MRILHTSDWHLGQHFMGKSRQHEHQALINWLLQQISVQQIDLVIIAGDIFDTGTPPSYARELYHDLIIGVHDAGCQLVILAGNHDAVAMLSESQRISARLGTTVITQPTANLADQLILLKQRDGNPAGLLCAAPYLRPRDLLQSQAGQSADDKQNALLKAIQNHYQQLYQLAFQRRQELGLSLPILATGHLSCVGTSTSEAMREIYVGNLDTLPLQAFPPFDYIALGHIHKPCKVAGLSHIRYSGSPIALSFDEISDTKQMLLIELDRSGVQQIDSLNVPVFQKLISVQGELSELARLIAEAAAQHGTDTNPWLEVTVCSDDYLSDLQQRVQALCEDHGLELLRLRRQRQAVNPSLNSLQQVSLGELKPDEVFARRLACETLHPELTLQLQQRFQQVLTEIEQVQA